MSYAEGTKVSTSRSRQEIQELLERHRAVRTYTATEDGRAIVGFELDDRRIQFELTLPPKEDFAMRLLRGRRVEASPEHQHREWEQACRMKWRALVLALRSKFVSIDSGIETTEQAFLAHIVLPNKQTVHRWFKAQLAHAYENGHVPKLMLGAGAP